MARRPSRWLAIVLATGAVALATLASISLAGWRTQGGAGVWTWHVADGAFVVFTRTITSATAPTTVAIKASGDTSSSISIDMVSDRHIQVSVGSFGEQLWWRPSHQDCGGVKVATLTTTLSASIFMTSTPLIPAAVLALILAAAAFWWSTRTPPPGHCVHCGYDLRPTPEAAVCPECGRPSPNETTRAVQRGS